MITTATENIRQSIGARATAPGIIVQLEDYWLDNSGNFETRTCSSHHALSLMHSDRSDRTQVWARYATSADEKYVLQRNIVFDPSDTARQAYVLQRPQRKRAISCYFDPVVFNERTGLNGDWTATQLRAFHAISGPLMLDAMRQLFRELSAPGFSTDLLIDALGRVLTVEIERYVKLRVPPTASDGRRLAHRHLAKIRDYLDGTHGYGITVQNLAENCCVHPDHLRRAFRESTGQTLGTYIAQIRISKAKDLLAEQRMTLKQIAHHVGFASPNSFCIAFRRETGETPAKYRARVRR